MKCKVLLKALALLVAFLFLFYGSPVLAGPLAGIPCNGNFDYDQDVDANDLTEFLIHFGRESSLDPCPPSGPAMVPQTGQTIMYVEGDDGHWERGESWPNPRFTKHGDGTVTDNLTGLMWTQDAGLASVNWFSAFDKIYNMNVTGIDNYGYNDWRLPNLFEIESLRHLGYAGPCVPDTNGAGHWTTNGDPFDNVQSDTYWSSSTNFANISYARCVNFSDGTVTLEVKATTTHYVWPVRGGQGILGTSCDGNCDSAAPVLCFCDEFCAAIGDCCPDACTECSYDCP